MAARGAAQQAAMPVIGFLNSSSPDVDGDACVRTGKASAMPATSKAKRDDRVPMG